MFKRSRGVVAAMGHSMLRRCLLTLTDSLDFLFMSANKARTGRLPVWHMNNKAGGSLTEC